MASVSSLDKDLRKMRLDKYTPGAAKETKTWIESVLGERLPANDLLEGLKDGVALCTLVNLAIGPPGVKFKRSAMPFVQMENISQFLRACKSPPLNMHDHDVFLTVDLYEQKDPAQVLQCLGAFSRAANAVNPSAFPAPIGAAKPQGVVSPHSTGNTTPTRNRGFSNVSNNSSAYGSTRSAVGLSPARTGDSGSGRWSPTKSPTGDRVGSPGVSSWSKRNQEGVTSPAWNIAQYGYMGGASQGNLGIVYGTGRRQITSSSPTVPSLADKERRRKEQEAEAAEQRRQMEEQERIRRAEIEAEEKRAREEEERRWEEESRRAREAEKRKADEEKRKWEEEERQWRLTEEKRRKDEEDAEARLAEERRATKASLDSSADGYKDRIKQLEEELERARQREAEYEEDRQRRSGRRDRSKSRARSQSRPRLQERTPSRQDSWRTGEREYLQTQWDNYQEDQQPQQLVPSSQPSRPLPQPTTAPKPAIPAPIKTHRTGEALPTPPIKTHRTGEKLPTPPVKPQRTGESRPLPVPGRPQNQGPAGYQPSPLSQSTSRPLPEPSNPAASPYDAAAPAHASRTDRFLASNPAPVQQAPQQTYSRELGFTAEQDAEDRRRAQSQTKTKAGGWAGKSLLEREMEMERQRQREWEEAQAETAKAVRTSDGVDGIGGGVGGRWDVGQWAGYTGGDNQNKGAQGIGAGRRQIVGPRPLPGRP
ncbi:uncharacterized protein B0I36DRAFT_346267 [Microdochium trichocladiopsis]|uniref:Calponin-homology (CH) domain-containing protein n=1 Tax=Microdochium trichocladiopsis TaxID=1682393 RepID=A0A9P8YFA8_9PEZI|nr:uncharacterized protein B0I36DRAFT_346267 [Microdochium trichocladiopsis]KAH7038268.1 hypothetical protein B0I36DRAFT_346267 [Microdochium trichocladiopsis]